MSDNTKTNQEPSPRLPSHIAYQVCERKGRKTKWLPLGAIWPHADGDGYNLELDALPLGSRIVIRVASEKKH
jgi:hypothetical protein